MNPLINAANAFLHQTPSARNVQHLPIHVQNINNLLIDFQRLHTRLRADTAQRLMLRLRHTNDALDNLDQHLAILEEGAPPPPERQWERCPTTGARRLGVNSDLLATLSSEGMHDHEIAQHLSCSRSTVIRRRKELGIEKRKWTELSQDDLVEVSAV